MIKNLTILLSNLLTVNEAYDLLEEIYSDVCCSDADYGDRPYYEIIEVEE